jgi:DNA repair protein RadC
MPKEASMTTSPEGHRQRLKQRFAKSGFQGFHDYEVLELLLMYAVPRKDTKPIAKELIKRFKNLPGVLSADRKQLEEVDGIGSQTSQFLITLDALIGYYFDQKAISGDIQFTQLPQLVDYFRATIGRGTNETMRVLYLNSLNRLLYAENLTEGTVSETVVLPRKMVENALEHNATTVIIAHNHPGGLAEPSENDDAITQKVKNALQTVNITLQEHIIIAEDGFYSYRQNGILG